MISLMENRSFFTYVKSGYSGNEKMKLNNSGIRLIGLNKIFAFLSQGNQRYIKYIFKKFINRLDTFYAHAGLIEYEPGKLALMSLGEVYVFDISGDFTEGPVMTHDVNTYGAAYGNLIKASDGLLYGLTRKIGTIIGADKATLFSLDPAGWAVTFYDLPDGVSEANIGLAEYNGKLYGSTKSGGSLLALLLMFGALGLRRKMRQQR